LGDGSPRDGATLEATHISDDDGEPEFAEPEPAESELGEEDSVLAEGRRLLADAERKLAAVERALARLDSGGYGTCEVCGTAIDQALLDVRPSLTRCPVHDHAS
jgi:RNA polymerase-binding transcription factor DksA